MSTHLQGFGLTSEVFLHHFVLAKLATSSMGITVAIKGPFKGSLLGGSHDIPMRHPVEEK